MTDRLTSYAFTAKHLTPSQVAATFVPPPGFANLIAPAHTVLLGPRGSGKTTLLKMLLQEALDNWEGQHADEVAESIRFSTAFVGAEGRWSHHLDTWVSEPSKELADEQLSHAAYTTRALRALVTAMRVRLGPARGPAPLRRVRPVALSQDSEIAVAMELSAVWRLAVTVPSLASVRQALNRRLLDIRLQARLAATNTPIAPRASVLSDEALHLPLLDAASAGIQVYNDYVGDEGGLWALGLDELELAPGSVVRMIADAVRAFQDERILLKVAISPAGEAFTTFEAAMHAAPSHDYNFMRLWAPDRGDGVQFCRALWDKLLETRRFPKLDPKAVLGPSYFEPVAGKDGTEYGPGSRWDTFIRSMSKSDRTFRRYLEDQGVEAGTIHDIRDETLKAELRKVAPLLPLRQFYRLPDHRQYSGRRMKGRKTAVLYKGALAIFAATEANPRWVMSLFSELLDGMGDGRISPKAQASAISNTASRFVALLATIPVPPQESGSLAVDGGDVQDLLGVVEAIARFFHRQHVYEDFSADPPSTFVVDQGISQRTHELLVRAVRWGAIVHVPGTSDPLVLSTLFGYRFRVSWMLAPVYGLPVRLGRERHLSGILREVSLPSEEEQWALPLGDGAIERKEGNI